MRLGECDQVVVRARRQVLDEKFHDAAENLSGETENGWFGHCERCRVANQ